MSYNIPSRYLTLVIFPLSDHPKLLSSSALNFLVAITSADLHVYSSATLGFSNFGAQRAGTGGFSRVDIG